MAMALSQQQRESSQESRPVVFVGLALESRAYAAVVKLQLTLKLTITMASKCNVNNDANNRGSDTKAVVTVTETVLAKTTTQCDDNQRSRNKAQK